MTPLFFLNNEVLYNGSPAFHLVTEKNKGILSGIKQRSHSISHADFNSPPHQHPFTVTITNASVPIQWLAQLLSHTRLPHPSRPPTTSDLGKSQSAPISELTHSRFLNPLPILHLFFQSKTLEFTYPML